MFESVADPARTGLWDVDIERLNQGLSELSVRLAQLAAVETNTATIRTSRPIDDLMLGFESLGDNCEFGLVQRSAGVEPLGLLRFNGFFVPPEFRLGKLVAALNRAFEGLGAPNTITVSPEGIPGQRELIVRESVYEFWYHTGIEEGAVTPEAQSEREAVRLDFLRRKLLQDLASGEKTWVWKSQPTTHRDQLVPLLEALRRMGPNTLLWVAEADAGHAPGTVERLEPDFIKGYVRHFAPYGAVTNIDLAAWLVLCWHADELRFPNPAKPEAENHQPPPHPLSAMDYLARAPAQPAEGPLATPVAAGHASRLWHWLRRRLPQAAMRSVF